LLPYQAIAWAKANASVTCTVRHVPTVFLYFLSYALSVFSYRNVIPKYIKLFRTLKGVSYLTVMQVPCIFVSSLKSQKYSIFLCPTAGSRMPNRGVFGLKSVHHGRITLPCTKCSFSFGRSICELFGKRTCRKARAEASLLCELFDRSFCLKGTRACWTLFFPIGTNDVAMMITLIWWEICRHF